MSLEIRPIKQTDLTIQLDKERRTVSFDTYDMSVRQMVDMFESKLIDISPEYQRQFVWSPLRESQLIESIFLGIPIPPIFLATNTDGTWEVVDGVQRMSTILHFCGDENSLREIQKSKSLVLSGLEKLSTFNDIAFVDFPKSIQTGFTLRPVKITTLNDKSDLKVRFDLFERLNTGGVKLQPQEIRNCIYNGKFNNFLKECSKNEDFNKVVRVRSGNESNGTREEFALRFFAFYENYKHFDHSVVDFLNDFMQDNMKKDPRPSAVANFVQTFSFLREELPNGIIHGNRNSMTPVNLFEAISVGVATALKTGKGLKHGIIGQIMREEELRKFTTGATNSKRMVVGRIEYVRDRILE